MKIVKIDEFRGGLNNQKMIMAGCFVLAKEKGARVQIPREIINFTPTVDGHRVEPLDFLNVFDKDVFQQAIPSNMLASDSDSITEVLSWRECFEVGGRALERRDNLARDVVAHLVANPELQYISNRILEWLRPINPFALQLRIERDWQEYLTKKFGAINLILGTQEITVDVDRILSKCRRTSDLSDQYNIWCCCDEDDLLVSKDDLKAQADLLGYSLFFKTDLPADISIPRERTRRSIVDFTVCMGLSKYVGLNRSTFSNQLFLMKNYERCPDGAKHYIYNNIGDALLERS